MLQIGSHFVELLKYDLDVQQHLYAALSVTKFICQVLQIGSHFVELLKYHIDVQQTHLCLAAALGGPKFITIIT